MNTNGEWAIVELMGHRTRAGWCSEVDRFGAKMLRIDIPHPEKKEGAIGINALSNEPAIGELFEATQFYGGSAIFSYTPCAEEVVRKHLAPWTPPARLQLPSKRSEEDEPQESEEQEMPEREPYDF